MAKILIAVFLGGDTGSLLCYCVQVVLHKRIVSYSFPWTAFVVNITGNFLIGLFYALSTRFNLSTEVHMLLTIGPYDGFITFSVFSNDGLILMEQGFYGLFVTYTLLSIPLGIFVASGGSIVGRTF